MRGFEIILDFFWYSLFEISREIVVFVSFFRSCGRLDWMKKRNRWDCGCCFSFDCILVLHS